MLMKISTLFKDLLVKVLNIENSNISEIQKNKKINKEVGKVYKYIKVENKKDVDKLADNIINGLRTDIQKKRGMRYKGQHSLGGKKLTEKEINRQKEIRKQLKKIQLQQQQKQKIINEKVGGKTTNQRLTRNQNKLKQDIKKLKTKRESLLKRFDKERKRTKRLFKVDSHRITERVKQFGMDLAKDLGFEFDRQWNCVFKNTRDAHAKMHKQRADKNGYFHTEGFKTKCPKGFGVAKLDCNCQCYVTIVKKEGIS